ncbi:KAT8 regulatory NSL complex subunit 1 [Colossoma macropomum]|uniref:KAT8 regulatory NSL complex subunit 1 n=1 Tax=Colossoma macropomum TaxID=42526 RepID=UPI001863E10A|nr:KAT8 regulatory NSL complex subunit 1 [Colossoma macropomum]
MYYYCRRATMSAAGPGLEGCCGGGDGGGGGGAGAGGGGGEGGCCGRLVNGTRGSERESVVAEARDDTTLRRKARKDGLLANGAAAVADVTREGGEESEGARKKRCCCGLGRVGIDQSGGRSRGSERTAMRTTTTLFSGGQGFLAACDGRPEPTACKRRACAFTRTAKRVCCGSSDGEGEAGARTRRSGGSCVPSPPGEAKANGNGTARGRVRLYRVRSYLATTMGHHNGMSGDDGPQVDIRENLEAQVLNGALWANGEHPAERGGPRSAVARVEEAKGEAGRRQVELEERTDRLWRRLQAVQVKQVERHIAQQLGGLQRRATGRRSSLELSRLARSCGEVLRTAGGALDSDHTASSSGGGSDSEEEEEGRRRVLPASVRSVRMSREWQWMRDRAWLGSRWVWLQAQVSELEYRIRALTELYTHLRQGKVRATHSVPETPLRAPRPLRTSLDCRSSTVGDPLRKMDDAALSTLTPPSPPSSAARVRPLLRQRRHRLIRLEGCAALGSKPMTLPCCCVPPTVCVLCGAAPPAEKEKRAWMRQKELDPCVHSVLSMPSDFPLALHCGTPPLAGPQSHSAVRWTSIAASSWLSRRGQGPQRAGRARRRLVCPRPPNALPLSFNTTSGSNCRIQRGVVSPGFFPQRASDLSPLPAMPPATDTPTQPLRRRRGESSFDIDNLVMPLGLAGLGARVQRLQYKEIITPSWRELDSVCGASEALVDAGSHSENHSDVPYQPDGDRPEDESEVEDLSDVVFLKRHAVCESRERSRWGSWAQRRRRGRSSSSYHGDGKSSRGLEQAPCSPDTRQGHFAEGDTSPCSPLCSGADDPFYQMEDEQQTVQPWECRSFPLLEAELRWLQNDEELDPEEDACAASGRSQSTDSGISVGSLELSPRTPQPHQQQLGTEPAGPQTLSCKPAAPTTQDSASLLPSLAPALLLSSQLHSPISPRAHTAMSSHRVSRTDASPF